MKQPEVHIYVCHHKHGYSFADEVFKPIHVGKAVSGLDLEILSDDTGDNISIKNKSFCELTAIYWAWKNDVTADWIGLMHYRRFLDINGSGGVIDNHGCINFDNLDQEAANRLGLSGPAVVDLIQKNPGINAVLPKKWSVKSAGFRSLSEHYALSDHHYEGDLNTVREVIRDFYPADEPIFDSVMARSEGYFTNIFILERKIFSEYCEWLFKILFEVERRCDTTNYSTMGKRVYGYLSERLFNVFIERNNRNLKSVLELNRIFIKDNTKSTQKPTPPKAPPENSISIVIASDNKFTPHLAALIESIKSTLSRKKYIDLIVFDGGITDHNKSLLQQQFHQNKNHDGSLTFIDCKSLYKNVETHMHFSTSTFYRIGIADILPNHEKAIYIDCDTIVLSDLDELWSIDLDGKAIAAAPDVIMKSFVNFGTPAMKEAGGKPAALYLKEHVGLGDRCDQYFQAGVIVFDLLRYRQLNIERDAIADLLEKKYWFLDQDILNKYLVGNVHFLDTAWNCVNVSMDIKNGLSKEWSFKVLEDLRNPKIVHFAGYEAKPWNNPKAPWSEIYWLHLRKTYWYEFVTMNFTPTESVASSLNRGMAYRVARAVWRRLPQAIRGSTSTMAHRFVRWYS